MINFIEATSAMEYINAIGNPNKKVFQWWNFADKMRVALGIKRINYTQQDLEIWKEKYLNEVTK
jgi:hypothetical protein